MKTIKTTRFLPTSHGERSFNIDLTTGWRESPFELYMHSDGTNSTDRTRLHLAINLQGPEIVDLARNAMKVTYPSASRLIESCRRNIAEGETETGSLDVAETVEKKIARLVLADMNPKHDFRFNSLRENTITNLLFLAINHEPTDSSIDMHNRVNNLARNPVLV
jgi:hypothetical protein